MAEQNCNAPDFLFGKVAQNLFSRHSVVFSNVPGPAEPVFICGKRLVGLQGIYPNLITQLICISYCGEMQMNLVTDPDIIDAPATLSEYYLDELNALASHYGIDPNDTSEPRPRIPTQPVAPGTTALI